MPIEPRGRARRRFNPLALAAALTALAAPAQAARECEHPGYAPSEGACARMANAELYYIDTGAVPNRQGETVVFLHAASGNADAFRQNLAAFRVAGYRAIAYDRKNVGRSSNTQRDDALRRPRGTTVQDLDDLANHLGLGQFHLVSVAAGAQVAIQYAAKNPARVQSLVLAATLGPPGLPANEPELAALQAAIELPFEIFCPDTITNPPPLPLRLVSTTSAPTVVVPTQLTEHRELGTAFRATNPEGLANFRAINQDARHRSFDGCRYTNIGANQPGLATNDPANPNTFAKIGALVQSRTLLLAGTGDVFYSPPVHMKLWGAHINDVQYTQLDTGHAPQLEDPAGFNAAVLRFLAGGYPFERLTKKR